jgi:hypothetical protein
MGLGDSTSSRQLYKFTILGMILVLAISSITRFSYADSINPGVFSIDSAPYGIPYKEWITRWWQWTFSIPKDDHPREDKTGEKCSVGQEGPVWFLTDIVESGKVIRTCTIPVGKAILFPILSGECDYGLPDVKNDLDLRKCALAGNEFGTIDATIDGVRLQNLEQYRIQSDFFNLKIIENSIFEDAAAGTFRAMVDGFFVFLEPLPPGKHDIRFTVTVLNPFEPGYNHAKDTTYHLIVKP